MCKQKLKLQPIVGVRTWEKRGNECGDANKKKPWGGSFGRLPLAEFGDDVAHSFAYQTAGVGVSDVLAASWFRREAKGQPTSLWLCPVPSRLAAGSFGLEIGCQFSPVSKVNSYHLGLSRYEEGWPRVVSVHTYM